MSLVREAYDHGIRSRENARMRISPFYEERVLIGGKRIDITPMLNAFWFAGFDGEPYPDKPDAMDPKADSLPAIERIAADSAAEGQNERRTSPESEIGACEEGSSGSRSGKDGA